MSLGGVHFSKKSDNWETPKAFYEELDKEFSFNLDPCPINPTEDGLKKKWYGSVFVNPPYSAVKEWLIKAHEELKAGNCHTVVFLVFARTDTAWFHDYVYGKAEIRFIRGRLKFLYEGEELNPSPSPSMVAVFRGDLYE